MELHFRRKDARTVIVHAVKLNARDWYVRATIRKSTTSEATELGVLRTFQLALLVAQRIDVGSLAALKKILF